MPQYVKKVTPLKARADRHTMVVNGDISVEQGWAQIKANYPLFEGQYYGEAHEQFSQEMTDKIGNTAAFKNASTSDLNVFKSVLQDHVIWRYVENTQYDEERMTFSCDIVEYFRDQASVDTAEAALEETTAFNTENRPAEQEPTYATVDFHRPYPS